MPQDNNDLLPLFAAAGQKYGIDPTLLMAVAKQESGLNPNTPDSYQGAQGLMQLLPSTARGLGVTDPRDPSQAIPAAAAYLRRGFDATGTPEGAIAYYHGGPDTRQWGPKTKAYVPAVASYYTNMKSQEKDPYADIADEALKALSPPSPVTSAPATQTASPIADPHAAIADEALAALQTPWQSRAAALPVPKIAAPASTAAGPSQAWRGNVLPVSSDEQGKLSLDLSAGLWQRGQEALGTAWNAFSAPHDVLVGKLDPNSDAAIGRMADLALMAGPGSAAVRSGLGAANPLAVPSAEALRASADTGYEAMRTSGVNYAPDAVSVLTKSIRDSLQKEGNHPTLQPKTYTALDNIGNLLAQGQPVPISDLDIAKKMLTKASRDFQNPSEQDAAGLAKKGLNSFLESPPKESVLSGDAESAATALKNARGDYAAAKKSETITTTEENASRRAEATHSGLNEDNAIRSRAASLLQNQKQIAGFSPEQRDALEQVARGTATRNVIRYVGNLFGGGGGIGQLVPMAASGAAGFFGSGYNPWGAMAAFAPTAVGTGLKTIGNRLTSNAMQRADELVRSGSPLAAQMNSSFIPSNPLFAGYRATPTLLPYMAGQATSPLLEYLNQERQ